MRKLIPIGLVSILLSKLAFAVEDMSAGAMYAGYLEDIGATISPVPAGTAVIILALIIWYFFIREK